MSEVMTVSKSRKAAADKLGGIDILVNGRNLAIEYEEMERDGEWNCVLDVNLTGVLCQSVCSSDLKESSAGRIINISSISAGMRI